MRETEYFGDVRSRLTCLTKDSFLNLYEALLCYAVVRAGNRPLWVGRQLVDCACTAFLDTPTGFLARVHRYELFNRDADFLQLSRQVAEILGLGIEAIVLNARLWSMATTNSWRLVDEVLGTPLSTLIEADDDEEIADLTVDDQEAPT